MLLSPQSICKNCGKLFRSQRAGAQYCSGKCRIAAHRKRHKLLPPVIWLGEEPGLGSVSRSKNADGTPALSNEALAEKLLDIAETGDDGEPKTGRRYYYLAISHGYLKPDMGASDAAKASREAAYDRVNSVLAKLRKAGRLSWSMVLDLTRELVQWQTYGSAREARAYMRQSYDEDRWIGQGYYPIFIVEKDTMEPVCRPMASRWQMLFASSRVTFGLGLCAARPIR